MPVQGCSSGGKPGFKWGDSGACYTYESGNEVSRQSARKKAEAQGRAIKARGNLADIAEYDPTEIDDVTLNADYQSVMLWNTTLGDERDNVKSDISEYATKIISELVRRDKVKFDIDGMRPESVVLLAKTLQDIIISNRKFIDLVAIKPEDDVNR